MAVTMDVWGRRMSVDPDQTREERNHLERSLAERFNFYLVWVGLVTNAAFEVASQERAIRVAVLTTGLLISFLIWWTLWITAAKLRLTLAIMRGANPEHAGRINDDCPFLAWRPSRRWQEGSLGSLPENNQGETVVAKPSFGRLARGVTFFMAGWIPLACTICLAVLLSITVWELPIAQSQTPVIPAIATHNPPSRN